MCCSLFGNGLSLRGSFLPDDLVFKLLCLPPLPEAREAEAVVAVGQDAEAGLALGLVHHLEERLC